MLVWGGGGGDKGMFVEQWECGRETSRGTNCVYLIIFSTMARFFGSDVYLRTVYGMRYIRSNGRYDALGRWL